MKNLPCIFIFLLPSVISLAQSEMTEIQRLNFPYKNGYHMYFKGESRRYDQTKVNPYTGQPKYESENSEMWYDINNEWMDGSDTVVNFKVTIVNGTDTMVMNESPLVVNDTGMYYWSKINKEDEYYNKESKKDNRKTAGKKYTNYAILTPFKLNSSWESIDHSNKNSVYTCVEMDTLLKLPAGDFHAFGIKSESVQQDEKDYQIVLSFIEYYAQGIGKIQSEQYMYAVMKSSGERQLLFDEVIKLQKYYRE